MDMQVTPGDAIAARLLAWYDAHRRDLPWRRPPGMPGDPYRVWLSEIMLQQTTVQVVRGYFDAFLERWPTVMDLVAAPMDDVLHAWAGLGYYARARNLHKCARVVARELGGRFPDTEQELRQLPGIGRYTAAAVAVIAFDRRAVVVDGNVERVMARQFRIAEPLPGAKPLFYERADALTPEHRPGDYAQAVMDLGATICTPRKPKCLLCPLSEHCRGRDVAEDLPRKNRKTDKPVRSGRAYWLARDDGAILLRRRPDRGLLGGMMEVPGSGWTEKGAAEQPPPLEAEIWREMPGLVRHTFTHFHLEVSVRAGKVAGWPAAPEDCIWCRVDRLGAQALPSVMRKIVTHALKGLTEETGP